MLTLTCGAVQVLWHDKMLPSLGPEYQTLRPALGRTAGKFASFLLWARAGMAKLQVAEECVSDAEIQDTHDTLLPELPLLRRSNAQSPARSMRVVRVVFSGCAVLLSHMLFEVLRAMRGGDGIAAQGGGALQGGALALCAVAIDLGRCHRCLSRIDADGDGLIDTDASALIDAGGWGWEQVHGAPSSRRPYRRVAHPPRPPLPPARTQRSPSSSLPPSFIPPPFLFSSSL
eukprot:2480364-Rhodomonas_salina.1